jgi:hypothetical protein
LAATTGATGCSCSPSYPTPMASDYKGSTGEGCRRGSLAERMAIEAGADGETIRPHPDFVEWLMAYPIGWTDLNASGIASICEWSDGSDETS